MSPSRKARGKRYQQPLVCHIQEISQPLLVVCCYTTSNAITRLATLFQTQSATPSHSSITTKSTTLGIPQQLKEALHR
ncbi:hypothetical protein H9Q72_005242 [Fusarium xylarioides]|uniref:Uncharacterized protein n=1 Tax=Fusarium xylarioides TaxID=221167 RepID=A0A9P7I3D7_9HYPO|nr:hypothetical protein H9Q72_005242 [Fusarium xylarioides]